MILFDEDRLSDSPFVERIWRCHSEGTAPFLSIAVSRSELVVTKLQGKITMTVRGPETKATPLRDSPADYEIHASAWPSEKDEEGFADRMNSIPKYVVSSTLEKLEWNNSRLIRGEYPGRN